MLFHSAHLAPSNLAIKMAVALDLCLPLPLGSFTYVALISWGVQTLPFLPVLRDIS